MVISRDRCCFAVPLYNVGIYAILAQFAIVSIVAGVLSFAAPYIVAVSIPKFGSYIFGAVCLIVFALQSWGFFGVYKEKPTTYRKYVHVNMGAMAVAFILSLVWIIVSAARHTTAVNACIAQFVTDSDDSNTTTSDDSLISIDSGAVSGYTLCNIFTWVQLGIMGGLWLALLIVEFYFAMMSKIYGSEQRADHRRYNSIYTEQRQSFIRQSMLWDQRNSLDANDPSAAVPPGFAAHGRSFSSVSKSSALRNEVKIGQEEYDDGQETLAGDNSYSADNLAFNEKSPRKQAGGSDGYLDTGLYASPTKHSYATSTGSEFHPPSTYSHQYTNSRSNLAPENTSPAYQTNDHQRNRSAASAGDYNQSQHQPYYASNSQYLQSGNQQQQPQYGRDSRYDDNVVDDFTSYYTR